MFRTATAIAVAALFCAPAMAQTLSVGQYKGTIQITGVVDPANFCTGVTGGPGQYFNYAPGQTSISEATIKGFGLPWTETLLNNVNNASSSTIGGQYVNCAHTALPATTAFTAGTVGTATDYVDTTTSDTATCFASTGQYPKFTVASANNSSATPAQSYSLTILPVNGSESGFKTVSINAVLSAGSPSVALCNISQEAVYVYTQ